MPSLLLRFMKPEYVDSFLKGELWMSSLSTFWELETTHLTPAELAAGKKSEFIDKQNDFSEGTSIQIPKERAGNLLPDKMVDYVLNDVRFQIDAYKYCNLLCFCRLNLETNYTGSALIERRFQKLYRPNFMLNPKNLYILQNPSDSMLNFGDAVVVIKDVEALTERILHAVNREGGLCVIGDVRYHDMIDRTEPYTGFRHSASLRCETAYLHISSVTASVDERDVIHFGVMDKYTRYNDQHEWRVCWLPEKRDTEPRVLRVGNLSDLTTVVETKKLRDTLLEMNPGYFLGETDWVPRSIIGNTTYENFTNTIENIDGMCRPILEIG